MTRSTCESQRGLELYRTLTGCAMYHNARALQIEARPREHTTLSSLHNNSCRRVNSLQQYPSEKTLTYPERLCYF